MDAGAYRSRLGPHGTAASPTAREPTNMETDDDPLRCGDVRLLVPLLLFATACSSAGASIEAQFDSPGDVPIPTYATRRSLALDPSRGRRSTPRSRRHRPVRDKVVQTTDDQAGTVHRCTFDREEFGMVGSVERDDRHPISPRNRAACGATWFGSGPSSRRLADGELRGSVSWADASEAPASGLLEAGRPAVAVRSGDSSTGIVFRRRSR